MNRTLGFVLVVTSVILFVNACGGSAAPTSSPPTTANVSAPTESGPPQAPTASGTAEIPKACALLTARDVQAITGYGGGLADSQDMGADGTACTISTPDTKFRVQLTAGPGLPLLPTEKTVALEGGATAIVKDSGIGQGWMSVIRFPNYTVTLLFSGTAVTLDVDNKIAQVTKADGSKSTYAETYEALARAIAHNAARGAQMPSDVSDTSAKGDPCALLTLEDINAVMSDFEMTGPESSPSAYGGNICRFRGRSDTLKATVIVGAVYLTPGQFEQAKTQGAEQPMTVGGAAVIPLAGRAWLVNKGDKYVRLTIDLLGEDSSTAETLNQRLQVWFPALAEKIAAKM
jgi:hypothetical protein